MMSRHDFNVATIDQGICKTNWLQQKRKRSRLITSHQEKSMSQHRTVSWAFSLDFHLEHFGDSAQILFTV